MANQAVAKDPIYTSAFSNVAAGGHDVVAYFDRRRAVEGNDRYTTEWRGAVWKFSSSYNLAKFKADPEAFAPQYGGYCAWAMARGSFAKGDPDHWKVVDGKLYLNYNADIQNRWEQDIPGFIDRADGQWSQKTFD
ncbi:MAG: YHS domain-containing (seleno)protein [Pseudomonadota bacterium]